MIFLTTFTVAVTISALYCYFTRTFNYWKDRHVRGPKPVPFFGNIFKSALRYEHMSVILKQIYDSHRTEKVVGLFRMTTPSLLIRDLDIVKHVTIKDFDYFVDRGIDFSKEGLGTNLFHSDAETWRQLKHLVTPMFTNQKLKNMMHLFNDRADQFIDYLSEITVKTPEHDIYALMKKYTMSTISACAFGLDIDTFRGDIRTLMKIDTAIFTPSYVLELDMMYPGILKKMNMSIFPKFIPKFFKDLVETVITQRNGVPSNRNDFMDLILGIRNKKELEALNSTGNKHSQAVELTNSVIEAQAFAFFAAGYETTASTMCFLLYHLAMDYAIQERLTNEIDEYIQIHHGRIELETLKELTYLEQVLNETLRMYPNDDTLIRKAQNDYVCPGTNVKVAKGQMLMISILAIHRDEMYYPEPEKFNPNNFAPENVAGRHPCAYFPFGLGPRHCIGKRFAQVQSRVCVVKLLSTFRLEAGANTPGSVAFNPYRVTLAPKETIYVKLYQREDKMCITASNPTVVR